MRYVYQHIDSPNAAKLNGDGKVLQLLLTPVSNEALVDISLIGNGNEYFIAKNVTLILGTPLDVFEKEYNYDPTYQFVVRVLSGSVDMLLTVS
tara:strand:- start:53102 stop:53380 length:279 start_codon:yes stop_codon:yes gene_type:complete